MTTHTDTTPTDTKPAKATKPKKSPAPKKATASKKPAPAKGKSDIKAKLAEGAKKIREEEAAAKKNGAKTIDGKAQLLAPYPKLIECKDSIEEIQARCIKLNDSGTGMTLSPETTAGEFVRILDGLRKSEDNIQFVIGDLLIQGEALAEKWGVQKGMYEPFLVSTGRKIDSLKHYKGVCKAFPKKEDRRLGYTACRVMVKIPELEDRRKLVAEIVEIEKEKKAKVGTREIAEKAHKLIPKKKAKAGAVVPVVPSKEPKPVYTMTVSESEVYGQVVEAAKELDFLIQGAAFIADISGEQKMPLKESLERIARFFGKL